jgi:hypothetical protein
LQFKAKEGIWSQKKDKLKGPKKIKKNFCPLGDLLLKGKFLAPFFPENREKMSNFLIFIEILILSKKGTHATLIKKYDQKKIYANL